MNRKKAMSIFGLIVAGVIGIVFFWRKKRAYK